MNNSEDTEEIKTFPLYPYLLQGQQVFAKELFKYRTGLEKAVPQRGGTKDYLPDGSWLQGKRLEKFHQEREAVLAEPRVQRIVDLVKGEWNPDQELVELEKEMRSFWEHMGFVDNKRKWLFPEEALFLMETNVLEVWCRGIPLSIHQAYAMFTGDKFPSEYYQVYSHLRRIGYVVLRHQQRLSSTKYERQIGLDQYINKKDRKRGHKSEQEMVTPDSDSDSQSPAKRVNLESSSGYLDPAANIEMEITTEKTSEVEDKTPEGENMEYEPTSVQKEVDELTAVQDTDHILNGVKETEYKSEEQDSEQTCQRVQNMKSVSDENECKEDNLIDSSKIEEQNLCENMDSEGLSNSFSDLTVWKIQSTSQKYLITQWNFDEINLPDFGKSFDTAETVKLMRPEKRLLPGNFDLVQDSYQFDRKAMLNKKSSKLYLNVEINMFDDSLEFSCPEIMTGYQNVKKSCRNWLEYKTHQWKASESWDRSRDLAHLYSDKMKPLVLPEDATSTSAVLDKLNIIQEDQSHPNSGCKKDIPERVPTFDIYAPNIKFKKSAPGVPDHRVCVAKCSDPFPDFQQMTKVTQHLQDDVPLLWAVVDTGDIAFYEVTDLLLPVDITMG